ncbi:hypothetical protein K492DRAFT_205184 [Lichtheimia hyalospora FSU 10163]|nr:hypothetical protein K492DRAFT_205184 [Lichtheimia hyalospora FSU 10163]
MLERFPPEITCKIVCDLNRLDFIQCAQVNRSWRQQLPSYSAHLWKHVDIKENGHLAFLADNSCFRQYINSCTITMLNSNTMLYLALGRLQGCHLQSLDQFKIDDNKRLADLLKNVRCESLKITGVTGACLDFIGIITAASGGGHMQHFACHYDVMNAFDGVCLYPPPPPPPSLPPVPLPYATHLGLVSLALTTQNLKANWMDILQRCSTTLQHIHIDVRDPISCYDLMSTCPRLQSMFIGVYSIPKTVTWPPPSSDKPGLRYFCHWGACHDINAMKFVLDHQHTLEYLYLDTWVPVQVPPWHDLDSFQSTTLKTFVCSQMHNCSPDTIVSLIRQSTRLETVVLYPVDPVTDQIWHALMSLDTLQHLSIHLQLWHFGPDDVNQQWLTTIHRLGTMTTLRRLELTGLDGANSDQCSQLLQKLHDIPLVKLRLVSINALDDKTLEALVPHVHLSQVEIVDCTLVNINGIKTLIDGLPKLRNVTFSLSQAQRMPSGVDDFISYATGKGVKVVVNRLT